MRKKNEEAIKKNEDVVQEEPEIVQEEPEIVQEEPENVQEEPENVQEEPENVQEEAVEKHVDSSLVWDLSTLFEMKFMDPLNGQIVMVRRAFKPRGKLEFYCPEG